MAVDSPYKTLSWVRSLSASVAYYFVEQQQDGGDWEEIDRVYVNGDSWNYTFATDTLDDLSIYTFRITPTDAYGNACDAPLEIGPEKMVRTPDAVDYDVTFNSPATTVTFSA